MRYFQGRSAELWASAVSVHGKKAAAQRTDEEKGTGNEKPPAKPWPPARRGPYPTLKLISPFSAWRVRSGD